MANKTIKIKGLGIHEISDLDMIIKTKFLPNWGNDDGDDNVIEIWDESIQINTQPISVDTMLETMQQFKDIGSTHVGIIRHVDHHGYVFEGYDIQEVDNSEYTDLSQKEVDEGIDKVKAKIKELESLKAELEDDSISLDIRRHIVSRKL